ncbi:GIY-YIG nuclease family protein [Microvirga tunisiensis]|nr:GIY-YIG nuclease family protein [Microvirga tunisiensis]
MASWTGKAIVAPRSRLPDLLSRPEVTRTGVYVLSGPDPNDPLRSKVYVGEADSVKARLVQHNADEAKDFFNRVLVIVSKDENLTKAHARFLESRLIALTQAARRATLANGTAPDFTLLAEADTADMEFFVEQISLILPILGFDFAQPQPTISSSAKPESGPTPVFEMNAVGVTARAVETESGFLVLKGSTARAKGNESWDRYRDLRDRLLGEGRLIPSSDPSVLTFVEDVAFASPSAAAAVVYAGNMNGRIAWKVESTGQTYKDYQEAQIQQVANE